MYSIQQNDIVVTKTPIYETVSFGSFNDKQKPVMVVDSNVRGTVVSVSGAFIDVEFPQRVVQVPLAMAPSILNHV